MKNDLNAMAQRQSDAALVRQALEGNEEAFAALLRRHGPMILHVCQRVLSHQQDAEDGWDV